eukprot:3101393-Prymnesium_polylepis.3
MHHGHNGRVSAMREPPRPRYRSIAVRIVFCKPGRTHDRLPYSRGDASHTHTSDQTCGNGSLTQTGVNLNVLYGFIHAHYMSSSHRCPESHTLPFVQSIPSLIQGNIFLTR